MTLEDAQRCLRDATMIRELVQRAIAVFDEAVPLDQFLQSLADPQVKEKTLERGGILKGLRLVENFFQQAELVIREETEEPGQSTGPLPTDLADAFLAPVKSGAA